MVGDDKGRENLGDYGDFWGIFFDFFAFVDFFVGGVGAARSTRSTRTFLSADFGSTRSTRILEEMVGTGAWLGLALASFSECSEVL